METYRGPENAENEKPEDTIEMTEKPPQPPEQSPEKKTPKATNSSRNVKAAASLTPASLKSDKPAKIAEKKTPE